MKPKASKQTQAQPLIGWRLDMVLDADQDLYRLASVIDWAGQPAPEASEDALMEALALEAAEEDEAGGRSL